MKKLAILLSIILSIFVTMLLNSGCVLTGNATDPSEQARRYGQFAAATVVRIARVKPSLQCTLSEVISQVDGVLLRDISKLPEVLEGYASAEFDNLVSDGIITKQESMLLSSGAVELTMELANYITEKLDNLPPDSQERLRIVSYFLLGAEEFLAAGCPE